MSCQCARATAPVDVPARAPCLIANLPQLRARQRRQIAARHVRRGDERWRRGGGPCGGAARRDGVGGGGGLMIAARRSTYTRCSMRRFASGAAPLPGVPQTSVLRSPRNSASGYAFAASTCSASASRAESRRAEQRRQHRRLARAERRRPDARLDVLRLEPRRRREHVGVEERERRLLLRLRHDRDRRSRPARRS